MRVNSPPVHSISVCVSCLLIPGYLNQVNPTAVQVTEKDTEGMKLSRDTARGETRNEYFLLGSYCVEWKRLGL